MFRVSRSSRSSPRGWERGGGGVFLVIGSWGCAAGLGRIFTSGLTIMGLHFQKSYSNYNGIAHFLDFGDQKNYLGSDLKMGRFLLHFFKSLINVSIHFSDHRTGIAQITLS